MTAAESNIAWKIDSPIQPTVMIYCLIILFLSCCSTFSSFLNFSRKRTHTESCEPIQAWLWWRGESWRKSNLRGLQNRWTVWESADGKVGWIYSSWKSGALMQNLKSSMTWKGGRVVHAFTIWADVVVVAAVYFLVKVRMGSLNCSSSSLKKLLQISRKKLRIPGMKKSILLLLDR